MAFRICEDVGTTKRRRMTPSRALKVWEAHSGICCICGLKIDGARERWIVEHIRALELGGEDTDENCAPAHEACARDKTRVDHKSAAQAKRRKQRHLGIRRPSRFPGSKDSRYRKKLNGDVVDRTTGEIIRKART